MAKHLEGRVNEFSLSELQGTRCRLQRLHDLKFFSGWIRTIEEHRLEVKLKSLAAVNERDEFNLEASIEMANVRIECLLIRREVETLWLAIRSEPVLTKPGQEARYCAQNISVSIQWQDSPMEAETVDISESGIGVWTLVALPRFARVTLMVREGSTMVECTGTVRYSRLDPTQDGVYRTGIQIEFQDCLSQAMWHRLARSANQTTIKAA